LKPRPAEVAFERVCREQGIRLLHGLPFHPTTQGKIERLHQTMQEECLFVLGPFETLEAAQAGIDLWREEYNTTRPHQSLDMMSPAERFVARAPVRIRAFPGVIDGELPEEDEVLEEQEIRDQEHVFLPVELPSPRGVHAVELERLGPASGNLSVAHQQIWLGAQHAGKPMTVWAGTSSIHVIIDGRVQKTVPSRLSSVDLQRLLHNGGHLAGPPPRSSAAVGITAMHNPIEFERTVNTIGYVSVAGRTFGVGVTLAGRRVTLRLEEDLLFVTLDGFIVSTMASPVPLTARARIRGARVATPMPPAKTGPLIVKRRISSRGSLSIGGERYQVGLQHAERFVQVYVTDELLTVTDEGEILKEIGRRDRKEKLRLKGGEWARRLANNP
jgi:hypothetical protein